MNRKIKILGLAIVAVLAMNAFAAAGAQATIGKFTASSYTAHGEGSQTTKHVFTVQGQKVECTEASFTGELAAASTQITITPSYNNCTAFGFIGAKVDMNGCDYLFTQEGTNGVEYTGSVHVQCPAGNTITITAGGCTIHISPQTPTTNKVDFNNQAGGVLVTSTVGGIHASVTSSFPCTLSTKSTDESGTYTGSTLFESTEGKTIDIG